MVEATRTVRIPLIVPADRRDDLHQTHPKYQHCHNKTVEYCWPTTPKQPDDLITDKGDAEAALYDQLREETDGLHANLVQKAIRTPPAQSGPPSPTGKAATGSANQSSMTRTIPRGR